MASQNPNRTLGDVLICSTTERRRQTPVQYGLVWRPGPLLRFYGWRIKGGDGETAPTAPVSGLLGRSEVVSPGVMVIKYPDSVTSCVYGVSAVTGGDWGLSFLIPGSAGAVCLRTHAAQFGFGRVDLQDRRRSFKERSLFEAEAESDTSLGASF